jgi:hypothetical protein
VKPSGAPDTGDLVRLKHQHERYKGWWDTGLIVECRGIECLVLWNHYPGLLQQSWFERSKLEVINETVN